MTKEAVGIFSFYSNISNLIVIFVDVSFYVFFYPKLIKYYSQQNSVETIQFLKENKRKMNYVVAIFSTALSIVFIAIIKIFYQSTIYEKNLLSVSGLIAGSYFLNLSLFYHYILYAAGKDKHILYAHFFTFVINFILSYYLITKFGLIGISISYFLSFFALYIIKEKFSKKYTFDSK
jgi:O-antigen/teichoic acid export membrane protein